MPDKDRQPFYCPYPGKSSRLAFFSCHAWLHVTDWCRRGKQIAGCKRKFASLWRLKVHYRAPPNERGSGKERGHGVELPICPACGETLQPKTHHNRCRAGRTSQPAKTAVKQRGKANRSSHVSTTVKRRLAKDEPKSNDMASANDAIGLPTALTETVVALPAKNLPACTAVEYMDDLPQNAFMVRDPAESHSDTAMAFYPPVTLP